MFDEVKEHWNNHQICKSLHNIVNGRPDSLYFLPEQHGVRVIVLKTNLTCFIPAVQMYVFNTLSLQQISFNDKSPIYETPPPPSPRLRALLTNKIASGGEEQGRGVF